jgi:hypothetical protein
MSFPVHLPEVLILSRGRCARSANRGAAWSDVLIGLVAIPAAIVLALSLRGRSAPPLRLYGPEGHLLNCGM